MSKNLVIFALFAALRSDDPSRLLMEEKNRWIVFLRKIRITKKTRFLEKQTRLFHTESCTECRIPVYSD